MTALFSPQSRRWSLALLSLLALLSICEVRADEWFMKIEGIKGNSTHARFPGWIPLESVSTLLYHPTNSTPSAEALLAFACTVAKPIDSISPQLLERCAKGTVHTSISFALLRSSPEATQYRITLKDVLISSLSQSGADGKPPSESISFTFQKIEWKYFELDEVGGNTGGVTGKFDIVAREGVLKERPPFRATFEVQNGRNGIVITFPAEQGHKYRMMGSPKIGEAWNALQDVTALEDGVISRFIPMEQPSLLLRVEQAD